MPARSSKKFSEEHSAFGYLEPKRPVCALRNAVVYLRVRRNFFAPLRARPILGRAHQSGTDTSPPGVFQNEPPFHVTHGVRPVATIGVRAHPNFKEAEKSALRSGDHEDHHGQNGGNLAGKDLSEFARVLFSGRFWPQRLAQSRKLRNVRKLSKPDLEISHGRYVSRATHAILA